MGRTGRLTVAGLVAAAGAGAARLVVRRRERPQGATGTDPRPGRAQVVTVAGRPDEVLPRGRWPEPLRPLDGAVQLSARPAPGGRGTELAARPLGGHAELPGMAAHLVGDDPGRYLRQLLREAKQLVETGEVLRADRSRLDRPGAAG
ncbi:hypothetical protein [Micromonospora auratinigra]|uniref:Uncharacterized protein n=1 Tax=Micromonospora auratinigra TaxID=261654 RepID=A0A1A8ZNZ4_9ACTN|nr:hypothetical protein [Micromonospora auratinigra]SBT45587.1 hypothetical protein GA0070611_3081 [Micromonospora auratinigra]